MRRFMVAAMLVLMVVPSALAVDAFTTPDIEFYWPGFGHFLGTYTVTLRAADGSDTTRVADGIPHLGEWTEHAVNISIYEDVETIVSVYGIENGQMQAACRDTVVYDVPAVPHGCGCRYR